MDFKYLIYVVTDKRGHKDAVTADEPGDTVIISGMGNNGQRIFFESEAYHLSKWCEENGLTLEVIENTIYV